MRPLLFFILFSLSLWAGVARFTVVKGDVYVKRGDMTQVAAKGFELEEKDRVETGDGAKAQIIFKDETVITLGKNTHFGIDEYLSESGQEKASLNVTKGFFKSITGQIGKLAPDKFKVRTKTATIGIRGTHFVANISDEKELIGCLGGAIYVESEGKQVDLFSGEMVTVVPGKVPSVPVELNLKEIEQSAEAPSVEEITAKIKAIVLQEGSLKFDRDAIMAVLSDISRIQDNDVRRGLEDSLNDYLNEGFKKGLFERFHKVDASTVYPTDYTGTTSYTPLTWGVVTYNEPAATGTFYQNVSDAIPIQTYYELPDGTLPTATDTATISGMMGSTDDGTTIPAHWDGSGGSRQVVQFDGSVLAVSDANTFTAEPDFPVDYDLSQFSVIAPDATNNVQLTVDFGNRVWYGTIQFDIVNKETGETESYIQYFVSSGEGAVNPTGFVNDDVYQSAGDATLSGLDAYLFRYYGENVEQVGGSFNLIRTDGSAIVGSLILNNTSTTELFAKPVASGTYFDWGYWAAADFASLSDTDILAQNPRGAWIKPATGITETSAETIAGFAGSSVTASYSGSVYGTVHAPFAGTTELMKNGTVSMNFDFAAQNMNGAIDFDAGTDSWHMGITDAPIAGNGFAFDESQVSSLTVGPTDLSVGPTDYTNASVTEGSGTFYGSGAEHVGGGFETVLSNGNVAIGAFSASK